ncbi:RHS repeat-associated core domain-containing protein [Niveispirillum lacus]|uniref:RHS repeat-associated core domain-containing protein n=1 Tax=Niveispirillum lacus TaxID=1981099 RepID=UPI001056C5F3|nr:RHS repeat-associated core domain-containing protein [Niveispirillum lacus]
MDLGIDAVTRHSYDLLGRRTATTRGAASSAYGYDIAGQSKSLNHAWSGGPLAASYAYDDAGGLINEALDNAAFLWQPPATLAKTIAYDRASPINALTKVDGVTQTHDARGNRTGAAGRTWRYDTRNMLVGANAPGTAATYGYYPEGGRAWKQVNGVTTLYLELDGIEWGTYEPNGTLKERTIRASGAGGAVVAIHSPTAGLIRLLPNRQGSVIGWLRPDGKLGGANTYDAYGNSRQAGVAGPAFRYAGMRFDVETGLYHTPNRAYDPQDGRWMQLDPIGIKDGLNRYAHVKNSPVMGVDATGLADLNLLSPQDPLFLAGENSNAKGYYVIAGHGYEGGVADNRNLPNKVWIQEAVKLAQLMNENNYKKGTPVILLSCLSGREEFAKNLAIALQVSVISPQGYGVLPSSVDDNPNDNALPYKGGNKINFHSNSNEPATGSSEPILKFGSDGNINSNDPQIKNVTFDPKTGNVKFDHFKTGSRLPRKEKVCTREGGCQ